MLSDDDQSLAGKLMPFKELGISAAGFLSESGKPLLPSFGSLVQIPPGCDYEVTVKQGKPHSISDILVSPAQEMAIDTDEDEGRFEYERDA